MYSAHRRSGLELELQDLLRVLGIDLNLDPLEEQGML